MINNKSTTCTIVKKALIVLLVFLYSCTNEKSIDDPFEEQQIEINEEADNEEAIEIIDLIEPVIDKEATYISEDQPLACVVIPDLRMRDAPNGNLLKLDYDKTKYRHVAMKCYTFDDVKNDGTYDWLRIGKNEWIGTTDDWIKYSEINANNDFIASLTWLPEGEIKNYGPDPSRHFKLLQKEFDLDDSEIRIMSFLRKTIPGIHYGDIKLIDFDSRNPSEEAKREMYYELVLQYAIILSQGIDEKRSESAIDLKRKVIELESDQFKESFLWLISTFPEENLNFLTNKIYGNVIDFRTVIEYAAELNIYYLNDPTGFGMYESMVYIKDYQTQDDVLTVIGSAFLCYIENGEKIVFVDDKYNDISPDVVNNYLENEASSFEAKLRITDSGDYQLITVKVIPNN